MDEIKNKRINITVNKNNGIHDLTASEEKILNDIKDCIPNLSLSAVSVL